MKNYKFNYYKSIYFYSLILTLFSQENLQAMDYFDSQIDYWNENQTTKSPIIIEPKGKDENKDSVNSKTTFPWKQYMDPKNKEFFKEGDYTPPEPFMEVARSPTDENIKNWFEFMHQKNLIAARLNDRIQEYMKNNSDKTSIAKNNIESLPTKVNIKNPSIPQKPSAAVNIDPERFRLRMYFDSNCPHCRKMFGVLSKLQERGLKIEALQVDSGQVPSDEMIVPILKANPMELKKHGIKGVPFLLIADTKRQALLPPIEGYHEYEEVIALLNDASSKK
jgi:hypothetical protein